MTGENFRATILRPDDNDWRLVEKPSEYQRCRWLVFDSPRATHSAQRRACGRPAVFELNRRRRWTTGIRASWWGYCEEHAYGRIELDGHVYHAYEGDPAWLS